MNDTGTADLYQDFADPLLSFPALAALLFAALPVAMAQTLRDEVGATSRPQ